MADFYNLADQKLFKDYQFLPQEKYRLGLNLPTDATEDEVVTDQGIVNTDAFANTGGGGDFNPAGNMFGEGTAVSPVYGNTYIDTVRREGPESRQAVEALINAGGTYPAGLQSAEGGFEYTSDFGDNLDYSKGAFDSLESEDEKQNFLSKMFNRVGQIKEKLPGWAQAAVTALNPFSVIPSILSGFGGDGPTYGIAGLTDQQKAMYDSLASQGMLFNDQGIFKTLTGKNFMGTGYLEGQQDIYNDLKDQGYDVDDDGNITLNDELLDDNYFDNKNYLKNKIKEAFTVGKGKTIKDTTITPELINEFVFENKKDKDDSTTDDSTTTDNNTTDNTGTTTDDYQSGVHDYGNNDNNNNNNNNDGGNWGNDPGTPGGWGPGAKKDGGRVGLRYGGIASL